MAELDVSEFYTEGGLPCYTVETGGKGEARAQDGDTVGLSCHGKPFRVKDVARQDDGSWMGVVAHLVRDGARIYLQAGQQISFEEKNILRVFRQ